MSILNEFYSVEIEPYFVPAELIIICGYFVLEIFSPYRDNNTSKVSKKVSK